MVNWKKIGWNFSKAKYHVEQDVVYDYYKAVVQEITPQTKLLDIGCGSGLYVTIQINLELKRMNRKYTTNEFKDIVALLRKEVEDKVRCDL